MLERELSLSGACCETESGGTILLQLFEFKSHLLECVEELHIRRVKFASFVRLQNITQNLYYLIIFNIRNII